MFGQIANKRSELQALIASQVNPEVRAIQKKAGITDRSASEAPTPTDPLLRVSNPMYHSQPCHLTASKPDARLSLPPDHKDPPFRAGPYNPDFPLRSIEEELGREEGLGGQMPIETARARADRYFDQADRYMSHISETTAVPSSPSLGARSQRITHSRSRSSTASTIPAVLPSSAYPLGATVPKHAVLPRDFGELTELCAIWGKAFEHSRDRYRSFLDQHKQVSLVFLF